MVDWQYFPKSDSIPNHLSDIVTIFNKHEANIESKSKTLDSNAVLAIVRDALKMAGFKVEKSKRGADKIKVPVLFGANGKLEKYFNADAYSESTKTVIEVEAGRAFMNNQFLKDLFQACVMQNTDYLVIAVRKLHQHASRYEQDFTKIITFIDSLYVSSKFKIPLKGILIIGY